MSKSRFIGLVSCIVLAILALSALYLMLGDKNYALSELTTNPIVRQLRLPRLTGVIFTGILLSTAGFLVQQLTRNPIAEMSTLGISGGASLALSVLLTLGFSTSGLTAAVAASLGALTALVCVLLFTRRSRFQPLKILLVGTSIGLFTTSLASALTFARHDSQAYFLWIVGSFSGLTSAKVLLLGLTAGICLLLVLLFGRQIKLLGLGEELATSLGVSVSLTRAVILLCVAAASGVSVASVGVVSFVGLIAPQISRRFAKHHFAQNLVLSNLTGILVLVTADLLARNLVKPYEFPAGSLTLLVGAIFFVSLLSGKEKEGAK